MPRPATAAEMSSPAAARVAGGSAQAPSGSPRASRRLFLGQRQAPGSPGARVGRVPSASPAPAVAARTPSRSPPSATRSLRASAFAPCGASAHAAARASSGEPGQRISSVGASWTSSLRGSSPAAAPERASASACAPRRGRLGASSAELEGSSELPVASVPQEVKTLARERSGSLEGPQRRRGQGHSLAPAGQKSPAALQAVPGRPPLSVWDAPTPQRRVIVGGGGRRRALCAMLDSPAVSASAPASASSAAATSVPSFASVASVHSDLGEPGLGQSSSSSSVPSAPTDGSEVVSAAQSLSAGPPALAHRLYHAECAIVERDQRIEMLEMRLRELEASSSGTTAPAMSLPHPPPRAVVSEDESEEIVADVQAAVSKSQYLIEKLSDLHKWEEPERQWSALMSAHEDCKDRLAQIEALVQRRVDQLPSGDVELRVCRAVRGLCVGAQRLVPRRWALSA